MQSALANTLDRIRKPEYTGENRCTPCTILNVLIAVGLAAAVAVAMGSTAVGAAIIVAAAVLIYLRGYLVPGTPTITQKFFPDSILRWFDKDPAIETDLESNKDIVNPEYDDITTLLDDSGVVEDCAEDDDLCLTDSFGETWWRRIREFRDEDTTLDHLAAVLEVDPDELDIEEGPDGGRFNVTFEGDRIGGWNSRAAFLADLAAEPTLAEWIDDWEALGDHQRTRTIASLRAFLESCPDCEGALTPVENTVKSCCSSSIVTVEVDCQDCGARVFDGSYR